MCLLLDLLDDYCRLRARILCYHVVVYVFHLLICDSRQFLIASLLYFKSHHVQCAVE
jgi:hypothetical protein